MTVLMVLAVSTVMAVSVKTVTSLSETGRIRFRQGTVSNTELSEFFGAH